MFGEKKRVQWTAAGIGLLVLLILPDSCTGRVKGVFRDTLTPVHSFCLRITRSLKEGVDTVRGFGGLAEENRRLGEEVVKLQAKVQVDLKLAAENRRLSELLQFRDTQPRELIAARVAARTINGWWNSVRLDKGAADGIAADRAVISPDGLVGRTDEVSSHTTDVLLVSTRPAKYPLVLHGPVHLG